jgi:predicted SAM-dependent methyltransferase
MQISNGLPKNARVNLRLRSKLRHWVRKYRLAHLSGRRSKRIVIGSGGTRFEGWVPTEKDELDLLNESDWQRYFEESSLDAILAEHVWEHLTFTESLLAAQICYRYLKSGGYLRIAVPDGYHPNPNYIEDIKPGGIGLGADDHKVLYTYDTLSNVFESTGFKVNLLEYFDEEHHFHFVDWLSSDGFIERSRRFDSRNSDDPLAYTSIILDATKK